MLITILFAIFTFSSLFSGEKPIEIDHKGKTNINLSLFNI